MSDITLVQFLMALPILFFGVVVLGLVVSMVRRWFGDRGGKNLW